MSLTAKIAKNCGYDALDESPMDALISYKNALEELVDRIDVCLSLNRLGSRSAADVCGMLFSEGLGDLPPSRLRKLNLL